MTQSKNSALKLYIKLKSICPMSHVSPIPREQHCPILTVTFDICVYKIALFTRWLRTYLDALTDQNQFILSQHDYKIVDWDVKP